MAEASWLPKYAEIFVQFLVDEPCNMLKPERSFDGRRPQARQTHTVCTTLA